MRSKRACGLGIGLALLLAVGGCIQEAGERSVNAVPTASQVGS
ncbi:MAG: hypothetical protein ABI629_08115 [bacterium]